jgi:hypothetical protein
VAVGVSEGHGPASRVHGSARWGGLPVGVGWPHEESEPA